MGHLITGSGRIGFVLRNAGPSTCVTRPPVRSRPEYAEWRHEPYPAMNLQGPSRPVAPLGIWLAVRERRIQRMREDAPTRVVFPEEVNVEWRFQRGKLLGFVASLRLLSPRSDFVHRHSDPQGWVWIHQVWPG